MTTVNFSFFPLHSSLDTLVNATFPKFEMSSIPSFLSIFKIPNNYNHTFIKPPLEIFNSKSMFDFNKSFYPQSNFTFNGLNFFNPTSYSNIDTFVSSNVPKTKSRQEYYGGNQNKDKIFDKMLKSVLKSEGDYVANDGGQACNKGIQQKTYNSYRSKKGLPKQDVKNISDAEVKDIYYTMYYKASGADKIEDPKLALHVFDTAVNMGVSAAKNLLEKSGNDVERFKKARINKYEAIARNNPNKLRYLTGWINRVNGVEEFARREFRA